MTSKTSDKLPNIHNLYKDTFVKIQTPNHKKKYIGSSVSARHTTVIDKDNGIVMDAGMISYEMRNSYRVLLITHGHSDHSLGIPQMYKDDGDEKLILFCPASICENIFMRIKCFLEMQKGRKYSSKEIMQRMEMYGVRIKHKTITDFDKLIEGKKEIMYDGYKIANVIEYDEGVNINDRGKKFCIRPFPCFHTVDVCGYSIEKIKHKIKDILKIGSGQIYKVNLTEDQPRRLTKFEKKEMKKNPDFKIKIDVDYDFSDVEEFSKNHYIDIECKIEEVILKSGHKLYQRNIIFKEDFEMIIKSKITEKDFQFFDRYGINIYDKIIIPETMFFGDTSKIVFKNHIVKKLLSKTKNVLIESTFLESRSNLSSKEVKKREKKDHMFLEDLIQIFGKYDSVDFVLMHFSARYTKKTIRDIFSKIKNDNICLLL